MITTTIRYHVWHWWKGDQYSDPGWVCTGGFSKAEAKETILRMQKDGWEKFRVRRVVREDLDVANFLEE